MVTRTALSLLSIFMLFFSVTAWCQSVEQQLKQARAQMLDGKRTDALKILVSIPSAVRDPKIQGLIDSYSTQFLVQENQSTYFEAVQAIETQKWSEARDRLEQVLLKETGHGLVAERLAQVELLLGQKDVALERVKQAHKLNPFSSRLKLLMPLASYAVNQDIDSLRQIEAHQKQLGLFWFMQHYPDLSADLKRKLDKEYRKCRENPADCWNRLFQNEKRRQFVWLPPCSESEFVQEMSTERVINDPPKNIPAKKTNE